MASILKRRGKLGTRYRVTVCVDGQRVSRTFVRKSEAVSWGEDAEGALRSGGYVGDAPPRDMCFSDAARRYELEVLPRKQPNTKEREIYILNLLAKFFGSRLVSSISASDIAEYIRSRERLGRAGKTILRELNVAGDLFESARLEWGCEIGRNPVRDAKKPSPGPGRLRFLTAVEARMLLDVCCESGNRMLYPYVLVQMHSGMRPSEGAGLTWDRVDIKARRIELYQTKTGKPRRVPLTRTAAAALDEIRPRKAAGYVFLPAAVSATVQRRPSLFFRRSFSTALRICALDDVHLHDLRHTAASHLLMAGVDLRTIAEILGHSTLSMLMRYTHLLDEHTRAAVEKIDGLGISR